MLLRDPCFFLYEIYAYQLQFISQILIFGKPHPASTRSRAWNTWSADFCQQPFSIAPDFVFFLFSSKQENAKSMTTLFFTCEKSIDCWRCSGRKVFFLWWHLTTIKYVFSFATPSVFLCKEKAIIEVWLHKIS